MCFLISFGIIFIGKKTFIDLHFINFFYIYLIYFTFTLSYSRKKSQYLHLILWIPSGRLSIRSDNEAAINFALSINFMLKYIVTTLSLISLSIYVAYFFIRMAKVLHFSVFSPRHSNYLSKSFANSFIIKW